MIDYLSMDWGRLAYRDTPGESVPLVLLHGTFCDAADWQGVVSRLPAGTRIVNLEFRGHGASSVPTRRFSMDDLAADILALAAHLGLSRMILAGHSLGGMVALRVADQSPAVAGLILLEGWTSRKTWGAFDGRHMYGNLSPNAVAAIQNQNANVRGRFDDAVWQSFQDSVTAFDGEPTLRRAAIPIDEVYGTVGRTANTAKALMIPDNPRIRIRWIPDAGHYLPHEVPEAVASVIGEALAKPGNSLCAK